MIFFYFIIQIIPSYVSFLIIYSIIINNLFFINNHFTSIMILSLIINS